MDETLNTAVEAIDVSCASDADVSVQSNFMDKVSFFIATSQRHRIISAPSQPMPKTWMTRLYADGVVPTDSWGTNNKTVKLTSTIQDNHEW
uniref:Uncharacterized protein n=1 Tax=Hyaloperonospora arabidopsidis (strain Emoy2) TaxID=559515 RepID=M4BG49_HYAAE